MYKRSKNIALPFLLFVGILTGLILGSSVAISAQEAGYADGTLTVLLDEWSLGFDEAVVYEEDLPDSDTTGRELTVHVVNDGNFEHDLAIKIETGGSLTGEEFYIRTERLEAGEEATFVVSLPIGEYYLFCSIPGHAERGQEGTLVIEEGSAPEETDDVDEEDDDNGYSY